MAAHDPLWPAMTGETRARSGRLPQIRAQKSGRLNSWKEIASYLERSVRTVRRWERTDKLPVHRHITLKLGRVFAFKDELDAWTRTRVLAPQVIQASEHQPHVPDSRSIAILPFQAGGVAGEPQSYFAEGLADEVTTALTRLHELRVTSRRSAISAAGRTADTKAVAAELGVRYLVEGSVRISSQRFRVSATLIDARDDVQRWADSFEGPIEDAFSLQQEIARSIIAALEIQLSPDEEKRLLDTPIRSSPAYEYYLRARHDMWRWRRDTIDNAVRLLHEALSIVGDHPRLFAALGLAHLQYREAGVDLTDAPLVEADRCVARLLAFDGESAHARQLRGWIAYSRGRIHEATRDLRAALEAEPSNSDTLLLLTNCLLISGRAAAAQPLLRRLTAVDPLTPITRCMPGYAAILEGQYAAAIEPYRQMFEMDPSNPMARLFYAWVLSLNQRYEGVTQLVRGVPPDQRNSIPGRLLFFLGRAAAGNPQEALAELTPEVQAVARGTDVFPRFIAEGFALAALGERAVHWLRIAVERGFVNYPYLARTDNAFMRIRGDPAFLALLETVRDRWEHSG
jgi:TolB-like protein